MSDEWVYDKVADAIMARNPIERYRLVGLKVRPRDGQAILDLIAIAQEVAEKQDPNPLKCKPDCGCLRCRARRVLAVIGGDA